MFSINIGVYEKKSVLTSMYFYGIRVFGIFFLLTLVSCDALQLDKSSTKEQKSEYSNDQPDTDTDTDPLSPTSSTNNKTNIKDISGNVVWDMESHIVTIKLQNFKGSIKDITLNSNNDLAILTEEGTVISCRITNLTYTDLSGNQTTIPRGCFVTDKLESNTVKIIDQKRSFSVLKSDGSVILTYLDKKTNQYSSKVLVEGGVNDILSTPSGDFAALKKDGSVVTGISQSDDTVLLTSEEKLKSKVKKILITKTYLVALKEDGSIFQWRNGREIKEVSTSRTSKLYKEQAGDCLAVLKEDGSVDYICYDKVTNLEPVESLPDTFAKGFRYVKLLPDETFISWTQIDQNSGVIDELKDGFKKIISNTSIYVLLKTTGKVFAWDSHGANSITTVKDKLQTGVIDIFSTENAFAALKDDGSVVTCGCGEGSSVIEDKLKDGALNIFPTATRFAVLKKDGTLVSWLCYYSQNVPAPVIINPEVVKVFSNPGRSTNFAVLKSDGSIITF